MSEGAPEAYPVPAGTSPAGATWQVLFGRAWPAVLGGLLLGVLNVFEDL